MDGLEHKDERLRAVEEPDWRDKLARLRDELGGSERDAGRDVETGEAGDASPGR